MYSFNFERLEVWQKSRTLAKKIYGLTKTFPEEEKYGLVNQLRRSIISVCSNISEGASRRSENDQKHFYIMAFSGLMECMNQIIISNDLEYIIEKTTLEMRKEIELVSYMLLKLRESRS